ncbi:hypothetical protein [Marinibacterium sp. SX1]|uniref:hypothetical protein n=1 Tax=Marinibacterium sp. SX1 TaxID=3388424 RepID=UPI003D181682
MTPPTTLPWPAVAILLGTSLGAAALAALVSPAAALPALAGALAGLVAGFLAPPGRETLPLLAGLAALALLLASPGPALLGLLALVLCALSGWEAMASGGRAAVLALYIWLAVQVIPAMPGTALAVPVAAAALLAGWGVARASGLSGKAARPPCSPLHGLILALYLAFGLGLALLVMHHLDSPFAHWIMLIFTMRALAPPAMTARATLRFGLGAGLGCLAGLAAIALHPPHGLAIALALACLVGAIRLVPHPRPFTPALVSAAVLLLVAPDAHAALFRMEITALVVTLSLGLSTALGLLLTDPRARPAA